MDQLNRSLWRKAFGMAKLYWASEEKKKAWGLLATLLILLAAVNGLNVVINFVGGYFMTALSEKDVPTFYRFLFIYGGVFVVGTPIVVLYAFMRDKLAVNWRRWMTNYLLDKYFKDRAYYRVNNQAHIDNPDERIAQDVEAFTRIALSLTLIVLGSIITFISFSAILWKISTVLFLALMAYAIIGSAITVFFGKRLIGLNFNQTRVEADFRFGLIHVRNNIESIAFYRGEEKEKAQVKARFAEAFKNFNFLIGWQRNLGMFTTAYDYFVVLVPILFIAPLYFAGDVPFGAITQASMAFSQILGAVSIIVSEFNRISAFAAYTNRLGGFVDALDEPAHKEGQPVIDVAIGDKIGMAKVTVMTPNYERTLVTDLTLDVAPGSGLLIVGPSGSGKSSLLRTTADLWQSGMGTLTRPQLQEMMFLPQRPYMVLGTLRDQLVYPGNAQVDDAELQRVLETVNLPDLATRVGGFDTQLSFADVLSLGEQQRVAFARLLIAKPRIAILDEGTSALDVSNEERLYGLLRAQGTTLVSVGHRPTLVRYHDKVLELVGDTTWKLHNAGEYKGMIGDECGGHNHDGDGPADAPQA